MARPLPILTALAVTAAILPVHAADDASSHGSSYGLTLRDHHFLPDRLEIAANTKVTLVVTNTDAGAEEFDSSDLKREKLIPAGATARILVGPLPPGDYRFEGEYHADTAHGTLVVR
jgi:plastocyanin